MMREGLIVSAANALGVTQHHEAEVTSLDEAPWYGSVSCRRKNVDDAYRVSVRWQDFDPGEGEYTVCLDRHRGDYEVGMDREVIVDPWFGYVRSSEGVVTSLFLLGVVGFLAVLMLPIGLWQYVVALKAARDPDPRVIG